jgi:hypothetical protein
LQGKGYEVTQGKGDRKRETKAKRERIMQKLRPMSEKPKKNSRIIITDGDGLESLVTFMAQKVRCSALTYKPYMLMWDDMVTHGNYKGWRYLNETVKVEWVQCGSGDYDPLYKHTFMSYKCDINDLISLRIFEQSNIKDKKKFTWSWGVYFGSVCLGTMGGATETIQEAKDAAIKCFNENIANRAEVEA